MKDKKPILLREIFVAILIAIAAVVVIITLLVLESEKPFSDWLQFWENIILGISCSVVASIVCAILARIYSRNDSDAVAKRLENIEAHLAVQDELYDSGIKSICLKSYFDHEDDYWNGIISGSVGRLDLVGHSLGKWFGQRYRDALARKVLQIVSSGGVVNIVLSTPDPHRIREMLSNVKASDGHKDIKLNKVEKTLFELYRFLKDDMPEKDKDNLKIYVTDVRRITYFYIRTDTRFIISPYTYNSETQENIILLELRPEAAYARALEDDFNEMISNLTPLDFKD